MRGRHFSIFSQFDFEQDKLNVTAHCWQYLSIQVAIPTLHVVSGPLALRVGRRHSLKSAAALSFCAHNRQSVRSGGFRKPDVRLKDAYAASRGLR